MWRYVFREAWSMKKIKEALPYLATLIALELVVFFLVYFFHSLIFKDFPITESLAKGAYAIFWRVISLQIFIQIILMFSLALFKRYKELFFLLIAVTGSLIISISIVYSPTLIPKLLSLPNKEEIGEGAAIILSIIIAWFFITYFKLFNNVYGAKNT
jgi:hypothetical protein